ncbi:fungal-specific transcription factor domain-containing protein [Fusarium solani]|uniref:Fungal-specific transcription factor domain-containing protein n=1 Tax=Fusarium solani TaxID=169388 RepID=A0A9P9G917_FUSSL|nr:fungal-specific transcription factor domain-containing protein [Fusarium solani]KAH7234591.1 fungal-specific transcription factor domain-containing protein [Fusarium solani]
MPQEVHTSESSQSAPAHPLDGIPQGLHSLPPVPKDFQQTRRLATTLALYPSHKRTDEALSSEVMLSICEYPLPEEFDGFVLDGCDAGGEGPDVLPDAEQPPGQHDEPTPTHRSSWPPSFAHISDLDGALVDALPESMSSPSSSLIRQTDDAHTSSQSCGVGTFNGLHENSAISSSIDTSQPFDALLTDMGDGGLTEDFAISPSYMSLMQPNYRTGGLDWLSFDIDHGPQNLQLDTLNNLYIPESWPSNMDQRDHETEGTSDHGGDDRTQHVRTHAETTRNIPSTRSPNLQLSTTSWPFDQAHDSMPHRYRLPPLRDVLSGCWRANRPAQTTLVDGFIRILSESPLPQLANLRDTHAVQAFGDLQRLVDSYFDRFHDVQAILHKPTWAMSLCPPALLTAMACIGALLSDKESDAELSWALGEICSTMITWMGASDATNYGDVSYLNALCLHQIYSLGSGNRQLYQSADRSRGTLIGGLRGMGLLKPRSAVSLDERGENIPISEDNQALTHEWKNWIMRESGRRAAWAAFEYDCSLCTLTSRRGVVDLSELPSLLPCPESIWNATSAQAWSALMSRLGPGSSRPSLSLVLKLALAGEQTPSFLGSWAKRLCSQVMGRLLWDLWQLEVVAMPEYCGLGSIISAHRDTKKSLLKSLNNMVDALAAPSTTSDLISYNIASLLCHYSHLCAANGVLDLVIYIVRNLVSSAPQQHNGIEVARARLKLTFAKDPKTARRLCWHATQIVTIANEYLVSAPCEIMRVFMGYIFIIAYSTYGPHRTASPSDWRAGELWVCSRYWYRQLRPRYQSRRPRDATEVEMLGIGW